MVSMVVGFVLSACSFNVIIYYFVNQYHFQLFLYWNITNLVYGLLNALLIFVINFETYPWVSKCFLKCCYAESSLEMQNEKSLQNGISKKPNQQKEDNFFENNCKILGKMIYQCIKGGLFSLISLALSIIIIVSVFIFCFKDRKKPQRPIRRYESSVGTIQVKSQIQRSQIAIHVS